MVALMFGWAATGGALFSLGGSVWSSSHKTLYHQVLRLFHSCFLKMQVDLRYFQPEPIVFLLNVNPNHMCGQMCPVALVLL